MSRQLPSIVSLDQAFIRVMDLAVERRTEPLPLTRAKGRILAENALAKTNLPPFPRAMMDGYALGAPDSTDGQGQYEVMGSLAAGDASSLAVGVGQAVRIMTGAAMPQGTDRVARLEWCDAQDGCVRVLRDVGIGESVQPAGEDGTVGQIIASDGTRLTGATMAAGQSFGIDTVTVAVRPTVAVIVTGNELVHDVAQPLSVGQIYGSNDLFIRHSIEDDGAKVLSVAYVRDDEVSIRAAISRAAGAADYVIITGGISVGDHDYVPGVLRQLGCTTGVERIWMRPGSPFITTRCGDAVVFALSGNPAACCIQFELLVRPAIRKSMGWRDTLFPSSGVLAASVNRKPVKHTYVLRAKAVIESGRVIVHPDMAQSPGIISSFSLANCLVRVDGGTASEGAVTPLRWIAFPCREPQH